MTIGVLTAEEIRDRIGVTFCVTCGCDTLPLSDGSCGWCDRDPFTGALAGRALRAAELKHDRKLAAQARWREKQAKCGSEAGYQGGCRGDRCRAAASACRRDRRARVKA